VGPWDRVIPLLLVCSFCSFVQVRTRMGYTTAGPGLHDSGVGQGTRAIRLISACGCEWGGGGGGGGVVGDCWLGLGFFFIEV
jgi:hypothetical protein